jgi:hypothetical protein
MERGLLDLTIELSTRDLRAGKQFALFVLIKNPFDKPVLIHQVNVSLPSELRLAMLEKEQDVMLRSLTENSLRIHPKKLRKLKTNIEILRVRIEHIIKKNLNIDDEIKDIEQRTEIIKNKINTLQQKLEEVEAENQTNSPNITKAQTIKLKSSLPEAQALQSGSTVVYTAVLYVKDVLTFLPSQYRLQFNVNYSFTAKQSENSEGIESREFVLFTNTVAHEISIRPAVASVVSGAAIGGLIGGIARLIQSPTISWANLTLADLALSMFLSILLSAIAVIFLARKSNVQTFVSVEDFWGGILIGFFVGYTGTSFFEKITNINAGVTPITTPPSIPVNPESFTP